ncbi:hypothetical protein [Ilumatobacter sp.]|uniref:hypothetical protein n=1 Tax=Ilumatobacter sp. TaxID=1967498 RepID=UPI003B51A949
MKPFAIWFAVIAVAFGALAVTTVVTRRTEQVFVVVDSSFPMVPVWARVPSELDRIGARDHTEFALATEKRSIHPYRAELGRPTGEPFAPCDFDALDAYADASVADDRILVTTPGSCDTDGLTGWTVVLLTP